MVLSENSSFVLEPLGLVEVTFTLWTVLTPRDASLDSAAAPTALERRGRRDLEPERMVMLALGYRVPISPVVVSVGWASGRWRAYLLSQCLPARLLR